MRIGRQVGRHPPPVNRRAGCSGVRRPTRRGAPVVPAARSRTIQDRGNDYEDLRDHISRSSTENRLSIFLLYRVLSSLRRPPRPIESRSNKLSLPASGTATCTPDAGPRQACRSAAEPTRAPQPISAVRPANGAARSPPCTKRRHGVPPLHQHPPAARPYQPIGTAPGSKPTRHVPARARPAPAARRRCPARDPRQPGTGGRGAVLEQPRVRPRATARSGASTRTGLRPAAWRTVSEDRRHSTVPTPPPPHPPAHNVVQVGTCPSAVDMVQAARGGDAAIEALPQLGDRGRRAWPQTGRDRAVPRCPRPRAAQAPRRRSRSPRPRP